HTRFSRDWSSDVCSSDLDARALLPKQVGYRVFHTEPGAFEIDPQYPIPVILGIIGYRDERRTLNASAIDQHIQLPPKPHRLLDQPLYFGASADVGLNELC